MTVPLRLLLVEDSETDAALALRALGRAGYDVSATRVETAEEMRAALGGRPWDLVIADYRLPRFDAPGALRVLHESGLDLPFIVVSGTVGEDVAVGMMRAGAHDYLMKDNLTRLAPAVARELREAATRRERRLMQETNARLLESLAAVNDLAIEVGGPHGVAELRAIMAEKLRAIADAAVVTVSSYDEAAGELVVEHLAMPASDGGIRESLVAALGGHAVGFRTPLTPEVTQQMLTVGVARYDGLHEVTFGAMSRPVAAALERLLGSGDIYGMALADGEQLLGSCMIAMRRGASPIPEQVRVALGRICSVALRRALAEEALEASRDDLEGILNAIPDPVFVKDSEHRFVLVNEAECALANHTRAETIGRTDGDFFPKEQVDVFWRRDEEVLRTGRESLHEEEVTDGRTGEVRTILTKKSRYLSPAGAFVVGVVRDITERKRAEERVRENEARFATIFHASPQAVALVRVRDSVLLDVNEAWCRVSGYSREEAVGRSTMDLGLWADPAERDRLLQSLAREGASQNVEVRMHARSGAVGDLLMSAVFVDVAGERCLLSMSVDIGDRKRAEEELRRQEERLRLAIEGAALGTWHWDVASGRLLWSDRAYEMCGVPPGTPRTHEEFLASVYPDDREAVAAALQAALGGAPYEVELRIRRPDGSERWIASSGRTYFDDGGTPVRMEGVVRDVTESKRLATQLRQAQKMEAIGQLAGGVAHDFNNILGVIQGRCELVLKTLAEDDPLHRNVRLIQQSGERAAALTRQLLAFSRQHPVRPEVLDVNECVRGIEAMLRRLIGEDVEFVTSLAPDLGRVKADGTQVEQVIVNLAVNARDAMPSGGRLLVETANVEPDDAFLRDHPGQAPGAYVSLAVSDTGTGMDRQTKERVFEPFFTTKEVGKGTGLGLSTVYGIVTQAGGHVSVDSEPGAGSVFRVYLPRTDDPVAAPAGPAAPQDLQGHGERVLVVEDDAEMREVVRDVLEGFGYRITAVGSPREAVAAIEQAGVQPDLLVTDCVMPGMSGGLLVDRLRRTLPRLPVVFMSGYADEGVFRNVPVAPGDLFVQKPFRSDELAAKVRAALAPKRG